MEKRYLTSLISLSITHAPSHSPSPRKCWQRSSWGPRSGPQTCSAWTSHSPGCHKTSDEGVELNQLARGLALLPYLHVEGITWQLTLKDPGAKSSSTNRAFTAFQSFFSMAPFRGPVINSLPLSIRGTYRKYCCFLWPHPSRKKRRNGQAYTWASA